MSNWRSDDEERYHDELDEEHEQDRRALSDDFAAFDAARYVRDARQRATSGLVTPQPDAEPEERDPTADWDDPLKRLPAHIRRSSAGTSEARRAMRAGFQRRYQSELSRVRRATQAAARSTDQERDPSLIGALFGSGLAPGLRFIVIGYGCFGLMLLIGLCGIFAWLLGVR
ncbi:MAG: hypothetical protein RML95_11390 [Anaerolineae bacterium]|nr:hypothetical protein [Anaerolineae bacterium]MDW8299927.1 hypothetical protein [Anaerolineae bacterium]